MTRTIDKIETLGNNKFLVTASLEAFTYDFEVDGSAINTYINEMCGTKLIQGIEDTVKETVEPVYEIIDQFNAHSCFSLYLDFIADQRKQGFLDRSYGGSDWEDGAVCVTLKNAPIAFLSFGKRKWGHSYYTTGAFVLPKYRRCGIHAKMYDLLKDHVKSNGYLSIESTVHVNNEASRKSMEKQGRKLTGYFYKEELVSWNLPLQEEEVIVPTTTDALAENSSKRAGTPRRARPQYWTRAECTVHETIMEIENLGAHPLLTECVQLLSMAKDKLSDWVDRPYHEFNQL